MTIVQNVTLSVVTARWWLLWNGK